MKVSVKPRALEYPKYHFPFCKGVKSGRTNSTPPNLLCAERHPFSLSGKTCYPKIWRCVETAAVGQATQTGFIKVVINRNNSIQCVEILAEFEDIDVDIQDRQGRPDIY